VSTDKGIEEYPVGQRRAFLFSPVRRQSETFSQLAAWTTGHATDELLLRGCKPDRADFYGRPRYLSGQDEWWHFDAVRFRPTCNGADMTEQSTSQARSVCNRQVPRDLFRTILTAISPRPLTLALDQATVR
jgi:hypothetical protein